MTGFQSVEQGIVPLMDVTESPEQVIPRVTFFLEPIIKNDEDPISFIRLLRLNYIKDYTVFLGLIVSFHLSPFRLSCILTCCERSFLMQNALEICSSLTLLGQI